MNFYLEKFDSFSDSKWDKIITSLDGSTFFHSSIIINYYCAFNENIKNISFLVKDDESKYVAAVVVGITKEKKQNKMSFSKTLCPMPALASLIKSKRTKLNDFIWREINKIASKNDIKKFKFKLYPINNYCIRNNIISSMNTFESLKYFSKIEVFNHLILNLKKSDTELNENLSKYRRKDIKKSIKEKISIQIVNNKNLSNIKLKMREFRLSHLESAGKITRPIKTWNLMESALKKNQAQLFEAKKAKKTISYLYCGKYGKSAWGWSQVNKKEHERKIPVRHYLEWYAINYFKKKGYIFYDLGERFYSSNFSSISQKEISISEFKEKYGAEMYPAIDFDAPITHENGSS